MTLEDIAAVRELEAFVRDRAARDAHFRRMLLADPREAISQALGVEVPDTLAIEVIETAPGEILLRLPPDAGALDGPLFAQTPPGDPGCDCCCCC